MSTSRVAITFAAFWLVMGCSERVRAGATPEAAAVAVATTNAPPPVTSASMSRGAVVPSKQLGPFTFDRATYTVELVLYKINSDTGVSRVTIRDSTGQPVYDEDLAGIMDPDPDNWTEVTANVLEDAAGRPLALLLRYGVYPSAPGTGESFRFVAPRNGRVQALIPMFDNSVNTSAGLPLSLVAGRQPAWLRLLEGNRLMLYRSLGYFGAIIPVHVDLSCAPGAENCVALAFTDSVGGLAHVDVDASLGNVPAAAGVPLFARPDSMTTPERVPIAPGDKIEVLGGAARVVIERDVRNLSLRVSDEWLQIRVHGSTGWIHGQKAFELIGLQMAG